MRNERGRAWAAEGAPVGTPTQSPRSCKPALLFRRVAGTDGLTLLLTGPRGRICQRSPRHRPSSLLAREWLAQARLEAAHAPEHPGYLAAQQLAEVVAEAWQVLVEGTWGEPVVQREVPDGAMRDDNASGCQVYVCAHSMIPYEAL